MIENLLIVAGIDDKNHFEPFIQDCLEKGINTKLHIFGWQDRATPLVAHERRWLAEVDEFAALEGRLAVLGISAGGCEAVYALQQRPGAIDLAINACGALQYPYSSHFNWLSGSDSTHFDAALQKLKPSAETDEKLVSIGTLYDGLVRRSAIRFGNSRLTRTVVPGHPLAINHVLKTMFPDLLAA